MKVSADSRRGRFIRAVGRTDPEFQREGGYPSTVLGRLLFALFNPLSANQAFPSETASDAKVPTAQAVRFPRPGLLRSTRFAITGLMEFLVMLIAVPILVIIALITRRPLKC